VYTYSMSEQIHHDQDAEVLLNTLLGELGDVGLITWDRGGYITSLSASCRALMQLPVSVSVGGPVGLLKQSPCRSFTQALDAFLEDTEARRLEQELMLSRDGKSYWLKLSVKRCTADCGEKSAFFMIVRDVTVRRQMMEQAQKTQDFFEAALRAIPDAAVFADDQGQMTKVSAGAERIFGYREDELLGRSIDTIADGLLWQEKPQQTNPEGPLPLFQMVESVDKDGRRFSTEVVTDWIRDKEGELLGTVAILRDVTKRLALQEDLLKQTLLLDSIFRQLPFALCVIDTEWQIIQMSNAALSLFSYTQDQTANHSMRMIYPSDDEFERVDCAIRLGKPDEPVVAQLVDAGGKHFMGCIQAAPLLSSDQTQQGYLVAIEDVTERIAHEKELRRYEQIVSASSDALIFIDKRHVYRAANDAYLKLWDKTKYEVIGVHASQVVGKAFYLKYTRPALIRCFSGETVYQNAIDVEYPTGSRFVDAILSPYRDECGEIAGVLITLRDITQRHLAEQAIHESQQRFHWAGEFAEFAVWELDVKTRCPVDDTMLRRLLGYSDDDSLDSLEAWLNIVVEPERQCMVDSFERILNGVETIERLEFRAKKKCGELIHVETLLEERETGGQRRLVGISRDITSLVREREDLLKYEHMTLATQDGLALVDCEHIYRAVNSFYTRQYGHSPEVIVGEPVSWLWGGELYQDVAKPMLDRCFSGADGHLERWWDYPVAGRRRVEISFSPYHDERGEISRVLVTTHDITENYLSQLALQESEEKFHAIFDHAPIGVVILDVADGRILDANPASLRMHGYERDEYLSLQLWELVVGITPQNLDAEWRRVTERPRSRFDSEHWCKDGSRIYVLIDASRMQLKGRPVIVCTLTDISMQKQMELRLREQQSQYRMLVESSNAILFAADPKTFRFLFVSPEAEKLLAYPVSAWSEEADFWINHLHPADRHWAPDYWRSMVEQCKDHDFDYRMIAADGRTVWLHDATSVIIEDGRVVSLVGVMVDITASKEAEEERWRLSEMVQQSADAILLTDTDFYITYINAAFTKLYGYTLEDLQGKRPEILNAEEDAEEIHPQIYWDLEAGKRVYRQLLNRRKDGSLFYCHHIITPLWNDEGDVIAYMSSQRNVTKRLQAEQALKESEEKYRQIVETAQEGIWVVDEEARTTFVNPRTAEMLGYKQAEMLGVQPFDFMDENNRQLAQEFWQRLPSDNKMVRELCYLRRDGSDLWCHVSISALLNRQGEFTGAMAMLTDISEQRQLTEALIRSQKMEAVGQLTGGIAHDFNNILGSILGFTELAQSRYSTADSKLQDYLAQIATAGGRARDLVRQLLIFSRGENTQSASSIPLPPLVMEVINMLRPMLPVSIEIRSVMPQDSPSVKVDPLHIQQVLMNLCINARDAIGDSGVITVRVMRRQYHEEHCAICNEPVSGRWVVIRVTDTGRGIAEFLREDMFQPFITSKEVGEGSGMGLAVVRGIVNSYNGHLLVESTVGQGTCFEILLQESLSVQERGELATDESLAELQLTGLVVLTVDDEPQFSHYYEELFHETGAELISCSSGIQALGRYQRDAPAIDLIITDQAMPGMSGIKMVQHLRELGCRAPAILCSGYGHDVEVARMEDLQIVDLLHKPVERGELLRTIRRVTVHD
jgi:PAS domain S-box-containing protein